MAEGSGLDNGWLKSIMTILASVLITGGAAYLAINSRMLVMGEQFRYAQGAIDRLVGRQELVIKEVDHLRYEHDALKGRLRLLERLLKQPDHDWSGED